MAEQKTNVMRILEQKKIPYTAHSYPHGEGPIDGVTVAGLLGMDPGRVFKTLVARGASKTPYVFVIPVEQELDLKKGARAVGEKSLEMLHVAELTPLTGYVRGGCSPIGMKKQLKTALDESAQPLETMVVSGGKIGAQVELSPRDLAGLIRAGFFPLTKER